MCLPPKYVILHLLKTSTQLMLKLSSSAEVTWQLVNIFPVPDLIVNDFGLFEIINAWLVMETMYNKNFTPFYCKELSSV